MFASIDDLEAGLAKVADEVDIFHTQDCISARAAARVRDAGASVQVVRTVHHVDDFTTQVLIDCQRKAIEEPDRLIVVSEDWRRQLQTDYGVDAAVIYNGVDANRFGPITAQRRADVRRGAGVGDRFVFLSVGGIEPRKGSVFLVRAMALLARRSAIPRRPWSSSVVIRSRTTSAIGTSARDPVRAGARARSRRDLGRLPQRRRAARVVPQCGRAGLPLAQGGMGPRRARGHGRRPPGGRPATSPFSASTSRRTGPQ